MAVMARDSWTDARLDDLKDRVDRGFAENRAEFRDVREEIREVHRQIGALNRTIHQFMFAMVGTVFLGFMGTIAALVTLT
ncbi:MAG TPA: hypothetical protein VFB52_12930 [Solirubrobacterales bacterium]|nr:hypothetical protein [Solirubrobacterales bacterium]